jgi:hypothetical protein
MHLSCKSHKARVEVFTQGAESKPHVIHRVDGVPCDSATLKIGAHECKPEEVLNGFPRPNHVAGANYVPLSDINPNLIAALQGPPLTPEENLLTEIFAPVDPSA